MEIESIPLNQATSFSRIISDYLANDEKLEFSHHGLPSIDSLLKAADGRVFGSTSRRILAGALRKQYEGIQNLGVTLQSIDALENEDTFTVTTGHQLCLFSGPLFSILKIVSAINLCRQLAQEQPKKTFVPVFWMASEDHDLEEANHVYLRGEKISWNAVQMGAVGRMNAIGVSELVSQLKDSFSPDFVSKIEKLLASYQADNIAVSSRHFFHELFAKHGLVILDGDDEELKRMFIPTMLDEVENSLAKTHVGSHNERLVSLGYKPQVNAPSCFLFRLEEGLRVRLDRVARDFQLADGTRKWSKEELKSDIDANPHLWSPNVVGRPLYQETILPNLGYVGGPGEIAYWLQLKSMFDAANVTFPSLILRNSATCLFPSIMKKMRSIGLDNDDIFKPENELIVELVRGQIPDLQDERDSLAELYAQIGEKLSKVDEGLLKSSQTEKDKAVKGLDTLESKSIRAAKRKNEELTTKVGAIMRSIKPNGIQQERQLNILEAMSVFGVDMIDNMIPVLNPLAHKMWIITR